MIFVRINKTGSTSVAEFIKGYADTLQLDKLNQRIDRMSGWLARERIKNTTSFTVVRNPFPRAVSCYEHCCRLKDDEKCGAWHTFQQYLETDFTQMLPKERAHSLRQVDFLRDHQDNISWVTHIFKLEDSELGIKVARLTGAKGTLPHRAKNVDDWKKYYSHPYIVGLVKTKYFLDFKSFNYDLKQLD